MKNIAKNYFLLPLVLMLVGFSFVFNGSAEAAVDTDLSKTMQLQKQQLADQWGIEILSMRLTAGSYMLDFRYKVVDTEKARPIFKRKVKAVLVDQESGARFMVPNTPKVGPLRSSNMPKVGKNYFMLFANPGQYIKSGSMVTVEVGDFVVQNLTVD
jgi:hypothetical protein